MKNLTYKKKRNIRRWRKRIEKSIFLAVLIFFVISFFARNNFKTVENPDPSLFNQPIKSELKDSSPIEFYQDGFQFTLEPLYEYEMSALVVNRFDYTWFSLTRADNTTPMDLCVTWGENVENGSYKHPSIKFWQDFRFCFGRWNSGVDFNWSEVSNNHLVIEDREIIKKALSITEGDQIRIKGKLVNLKAENIDGKKGKYEGIRDWSTSTTLEDTGGGACEVIFVEDLEIIKKSNLIFFYGFKISKFLLITFLLFKLSLFIFKLEK